MTNPATPPKTTTPAHRQKGGRHAARKNADLGSTIEPGQMSHRQILEALSGLLLGLFVAMLSSTVVSNALPGSSPTWRAASPATPGSWWPPS